MPLTVFIGYDPRERDAFDVARWSLVRRCSEPVYAFPLTQTALREVGLYSRTSYQDSSGQWYDTIDNKPFSTEFSFTRFLVPELARRAGIKDWVMFVDCDFLFLQDVAPLWDLCRTQHSTKALTVVPRQYASTSTTKMDGCKQEAYPRKLQSAMMLFNMKHPGNSELGISEVNSWKGSRLHNFEWLTGNEIGYLPPEWHSLNTDVAARGVIHYTEGGPWFDNYRSCAMANEWINEKAHYDAAHEVTRMPAMKIGIGA